MKQVGVIDSLTNKNYFTIYTRYIGILTESHLAIEYRFIDELIDKLVALKVKHDRMTNNETY